MNGWIVKRLNGNSIPFRNFMELALYDPEFGYYAQPRSGLDYATSVDISPAFAFSLSLLAGEFVDRAGDALCTIVDIGCGDGSLLSGIRENLPEEARRRARFVGVDRSLGRLRPELAADDAYQFVRAPNAIDAPGPALVLSNELFDAFPVARLVQRESGLRELWVRPLEDGVLEWEEKDAPPEYAAYFSERGIKLEPGQYADVTPGWGHFYEDLAARIERGLLITIDYGFPQEKLFDVRVRRYGTAVAFRRHQFTRDLLADPGAQDLTAHVNFTDLQAAGERNGWRTLVLERQAKFLLRIGITRHPLLAPLDALEGSGGDAVELATAREAARRLVLPDGIGEEMRVLVQEKGLTHEQWPFESDPGLFPNVM
ncbi:MAG TPA: SAM-dependent methyltransferase [Thermoanaerobaculia bacterium]|nr:SAM-dependent methyltransferase [Thermoanaerobaculia bacterium]